MQTRPILWERVSCVDGKGWIFACAGGEAAGIAAVATVYAMIDRGLIGSQASWILAVGAWEGFCLGLAQALVLSRKGVAMNRWIMSTMAGAVVGYGLSQLGGAGGGAESHVEPAIWLVVAMGVAFGLGMGALMGFVQWLGAREFLSAGRWIVRNMAGWALAMAIIMFAASSVGRTTPLVAVTGIGGLSGAIAGLMLGIVTRAGLPRGI